MGLTLTARTEARISSYLTERPSSSGNTAVTTLKQEVSTLATAAEKDKSSLEDVFQAKVCLVWMDSILEDHNKVLSTLSAQEIDQAIGRFTNIVSPTARSTHVCIVRGAYLRGVALEHSTRPKEAVQFYQSILPYLLQTHSTVGITPQSDIWTEKLLAQHCALVTSHLNVHATRPRALATSAHIPLKAILDPFRAWYAYRLERQKSSMFAYQWVWKAYYEALSFLLQNRIVQPLFNSRSDLRMELHKVQAILEAILMSHTSFPKANQTNVDIESWVDQVMANWRALLSPPWKEEDLGPGSIAALGKTTLQILYRAATRTFHSTSILRHLFAVHASLADFALAYKALNTYVEVMTKGRARVEKSGESEVGLDNDTTAMCTLSSGIKTLCVYGGRSEAERALEIAAGLEEWLKEAEPGNIANTSKTLENGTEAQKASFGTKKNIIHDHVIALAYHALGTSQATWARKTFDTSARPDLQNRAVVNLKKALSFDLSDDIKLEILVSLAHVLAEGREIDTAIRIAKSAVSIGYQDENEEEIQEDHLNPSRRSLILKAWHILVLLLSARQNFSAAMASCEAAFEVYGGQSSLNGDISVSAMPSGLLVSERNSLVAMKMTHMGLLEVVDGPEEAVNASEELLGLYAKLFKIMQQENLQTLNVKTKSPAASTIGTQKSFRGSLMGYPKDKKLRLPADGNITGSVGSLEPSHEADPSPAIAITTEETVLPQSLNHHQGFLGRHESNKLRKRNSHKNMGSQRRTRETSPEKPRASGDGHLLPPKGSQDGPSLDDPNGSAGLSVGNQYASDEVGVAISHDLPSTPPTPAAVADQSNPILSIASASQNMGQKNLNPRPIAPKPAQNPMPESFALSQNLMTLPEPSFPTILRSRYALTILIEIWCKISSLYRRASLFPDAQAAINEANTAVQTIESQIAEEEGSSASTFSTPGYGNLRALSELWADVFAERGKLHSSEGETEKATIAYETALGWWPDHPAAIVGLTNILLDTYQASNKQSSMVATGDGAKQLSSEDIPHSQPTLSTIPGFHKLSSVSDSKAAPDTKKAPVILTRSPPSDTSTSSQTSPSTPPSPTKLTNKTSKLTAHPTPLPPTSTTSPQTQPQQPQQPNPTSETTRQTKDLTALSARDRAYGLLSRLTKSGQGWDNSEAWFALARAYEYSGQADKAEEALWWVVELEEGRPVRGWDCVGWA